MQFCSFLPTKNTCSTKKTTQPRKGNTFFSEKCITYQTRVKKSKNVSPPPLEKLKIDVQEFNIFHIDSKIREFLNENRKTIPSLLSRLDDCKWILQNHQDPTQRIMARYEISNLRKRIQNIETNMDYNLYIYRTHGLVEEYRKLFRQSGAIDFVNNRSKIDNSGKLRDIVNHYLCIAQEYVQVENFCRKPKRIVCEACGCFDFDQSLDDDTIFICRKCATEVEILDDTPSFKDTDRVNMSSKYKYTRKGHFIDAIKKFQGVQNIDPKKIKKVVNTIKAEMKKHNLVAEQGHSNSLTKDQVYMFLFENDMSGHYDDVNLVFYILTGVECPNISAYLDDLYEDFDKLEEVLEEIKDEKRKNSLTVNYKLYKLLQRRGYPCRKDDFDILKTKEKESEHEEKMKEAWDRLGWKWIPTF